MKVPTKFEVDDLLPSYSVIAADTLRDLVTLTFDPLIIIIIIIIRTFVMRAVSANILNLRCRSLTSVSGHTWRVTWSIPPPSLKILRLSVLEL